MFSINNEIWYIKFVSPYDPMLQRSDGYYTVGSCDDDSKTVYINGTLKGELLRKVLCHEITHCAMFSYNVALSVQQEELLADLVATYGEEIINVTNKVFQKLKEM